MTTTTTEHIDAAIRLLDKTTAYGTDDSKRALVEHAAVRASLAQARALQDLAQAIRAAARPESALT